MNLDLLKSIGLTESQAKTYLALIEAGSLTGSQLAELSKENRTAAYMALAKLEELGLARVSKDTGAKVYEPASPSALEGFINKRRQELDSVDKTYRDSLSDMLTFYFERQSKPGVRYFSGFDGMLQIYEDHLQTGAHMQIVRTVADLEFGDKLFEALDREGEAGITKDVLGPALPESMEWSDRNNTRHHRTNYWLPPEYYTASVEVSIYGDKVSMISFGEETAGLIIESPQIAESMRQIFKLAKIGGETLMKRRQGT